MPGRPRVVIVGAGFAGLRAARILSHSQADVLVIDRNNYHTFFPLLYQVAAAELEPEDIIYPIRSIFRGNQRFRLLVDEVTAVDPENKLVKTIRDAFPYDYLVLALGSTTHFFGVEGASTYALPLKTLADAIAIRNHILTRFERALYEAGPEERRQMLTFAIVGGGPTGVEFSGALAELIHGPLAKDYPQLEFSEVRLMLIEATGHLLPNLPERLQVYALKRLRKMNVEVLLGGVVTQITPTSITLKDGTTIRLETVIWTAGVQGISPGIMPRNTTALPILANRQIKTLPTLQVLGYPEIYVAGDLAHIDENEHAAGMVATVAIQEGMLVARNILRQFDGQAPMAFHYQDLGTLAVIGRNAAAVQLGSRTFTGLLAWLLWLGVHIYRLIGFRNRLIVLVNWAWDYLFFDRGVRLIVPLPKES